MIPHLLRNPKLLPLAVIIAAVVSVFAAAPWTDGAQANASDSTIGLIAVDVDTAGNTATSLGPIDSCVRIDPEASATVDVIVDAIPADRPMTGFQFDLIYDPAIINLTANDPEMLLATNEDFVPIEVGEKAPDSDGLFLVAILDFSADSPAETGPGVLSRITLSAVGSGVTALSLTNTQVRDDYNEIIPIDDLAAANIAVGQDCPSGAPPPAQTPPATEPTPADGDGQTPGDGATPEPDTGTPGATTPGADGTPIILPGTGGTPSAGPNTPAPGETPGQPGTPPAGGAGLDTGDDGGGVGAWIAAPIAAAVLALLAAGYVGFRRIRGRAT